MTKNTKEIIKSLKSLYLKNTKENKYFLEEEQWFSLIDKYGLTRKEFLFLCVDFAKTFSISPVSRFKVGAVGVGQTNKLYFGSNIEFENFPLSQTIHAEQCLLSLVLSQKELGLKEIYLSAFPCGHCRQFLNEFHFFYRLIINVQSHQNKEFKLSSLLPYSFGPNDLGLPHYICSKNSLDGSKIKIDEKKIKNKDVLLKEKIMESFYNSYAPYSKSRSGIVFCLEKENYIIGSSFESCAFNPSLNAFHMAYSIMIMGNFKLKDLKCVYFIEAKNSKIKYFKGVKEFLNQVG